MKNDNRKKGRKKVLVLVGGLLICCTSIYAASLIMRWNGGNIIETSKQFITELSTTILNQKEKNDQLTDSNDKLTEENENLKNEIEDLKNQSTEPTPSPQPPVNDNQSGPTWDEHNKLQQQYYHMVEEVRKANQSAENLRIHMNTIKGNLAIAGIDIQTEIQQEQVSTNMVELN